MADLDILGRLSETGGGRQELELVMAEKLAARESRETAEELQLAALLGKTLLEKNEELELKLKRLQEFTEETLVNNQMLTRQLNESRDALHFSNQSCEQLEVKIEELEHSNSELERLCDCRLSAVQNKSKTVQDLQERLEAQQEEHSKLQQCYLDLEQARVRENEETDSLSVHNVSRSRSASLSKDGKSSRSSQSPEAAELQELVDELTFKLQNSNYQKQKLELEYQEVVEESQSMGKSLEKAEAEIAELQIRLKSYEEEASESQGGEPSPHPHPLSSSTPSASGRSSFQFSHTAPHGLEESPVHRPPNSLVTVESALGTSLFGELDSQYTSLKKQYEDLLQHCTCSASISHHSSGGHVPLDCTDSGRESLPGKKAGTAAPKPFRELFEEVFATLKQTAQVADRLIERRTAN